MKKVLIFIFLLGFSVYAKPKIWVEHSGGWFTSSTKVIHENGKVVGVFDVEEIVKDNSEALKLIKVSNSYSTSSIVSFSTFLLGGLFTGLSTSSAIELTPSIRQAYLGTGLGIVIASLVAMGYYGSKSVEYFHKAINTYNGVYETTPKSTAYHFDEELRGDIMLGMLRF